MQYCWSFYFLIFASIVIFTARVYQYVWLIFVLFTIFSLSIWWEVSTSWTKHYFCYLWSHQQFQLICPALFWFCCYWGSMWCQLLWSFVRLFIEFDCSRATISDQSCWFRLFWWEILFKIVRTMKMGGWSFSLAFLQTGSRIHGSKWW